mgnify:CR=1 FL=1
MSRWDIRFLFGLLYLLVIARSNVNPAAVLMFLAIGTGATQFVGIVMIWFAALARIGKDYSGVELQIISNLIKPLIELK